LTNETLRLRIFAGPNGSGKSSIINSIRNYTKDNGNVPEDKIRSRYIRTMDLMYAASQLAYRTYYFDNSAEGKDFNLFASFKVSKDREKKWDIREVSKVPIWFRNYYSAKVTRSIQNEND
jgi:predicted ABC-type ATPase